MTNITLFAKIMQTLDFLPSQSWSANMAPINMPKELQAGRIW